MRWTPYACGRVHGESRIRGPWLVWCVAEGIPMVTFDIGKQQQDALFEFEHGRLSALVADMAAVQRGDSPERLSNGEAPILDHWVMARRTIPCLAGLSSGHPRLVGSGRPIITSDLWLLSGGQDLGPNAVALVSVGPPRRACGRSVVRPA
jgi:hypothetical protein